MNNIIPTTMGVLDQTAATCLGATVYAIGRYCLGIPIVPLQSLPRVFAGALAGTIAGAVVTLIDTRERLWDAHVLGIILGVSAILADTSPEFYLVSLILGDFFTHNVLA